MSIINTLLIINYFFKNLFLVSITIIMSIWGIFISFVDKDGRIVHFYCARPWAKTILFMSNVKIQLEGLEFIDKATPKIYMANHQSYFDIFTLLAGLPVDFKFILKKELMRIPFLGTAMNRARYISIDRSDPRKALKSVNMAAQKMREGASVLIFPEGTRSEDGSVGTFKKGGFHLALKSGNDIVPISIINSRNIMSKGSLRIKKGTVIVKIGKGIPVKEYTKKELDKLGEKGRGSIISQMTGDNI